MTHLNILLLLTLTIVAPFPSRVVTRSIEGRVYFTNNTPADRASYPIKLLSADGKRIVRSIVQGDGGFKLSGIKPGEYLLRFKGPGSCSLTYRVDLRKSSRRNVSIIMDAACAHDDGTIRILGFGIQPAEQMAA